MEDRPADGEGRPRDDVNLALGDLELRTPSSHERRQLAERAVRPGAILDESSSGFLPWLAEGEASVRRRLTASVDPGRNAWTLELVVVRADRLIGMQVLCGFAAWPRRRVVGTSSWLFAEHQRRGHGTTARCAVLDLAFTRLGAHSARSWVLPDNIASRRVSEKLGYVEVGAREGELILELRHWTPKGTVIGVARPGDRGGDRDGA